MLKEKSLNGIWQLCWEDLNCGSLQKSLLRFKNKDTIPVRVPGSVHEALIENGIIKEPNIGLNANNSRWIEEKEWWFIYEFEIDKNFISKNIFLCFDGIDLTSSIWLNEKFIGTTNNAFIGFRFDVSKIIKKGKNILIVRLDEGIESVRKKSIKFTEYSWNREQPYRAWLRKPQYCYGWDWTFWLPSLGIWKDVYLESCEFARISEIYIYLKNSNLPVTNSNFIEIVVSANIERFKKESYKLECEILPDERFSKEKKLKKEEILFSDNSVNMTIKIDNPQLWWPSGLGRPYLYNIILNLMNKKGHLLHQRKIRYGIRTVDLQEFSLGKGHKTFTFTVNGVPFFAKGTNWVPVDTIPARITTLKIKRLLKDCWVSHVNMLRVWGGGIYESDDFFDLCDKYGIFVLQDFMFSCMFYPSHDREFRNNIKREAEYTIKRLRNHPSLIGWMGNNEIQCMYESIKKWHPNWNVKFYGEDIYEKILPDILNKLDPYRIYRPGSPYGGFPSDSGMEGDQHIWRFTHVTNHPDYLDLWQHTKEETKFLSEFGVLGPISIESLKKCISIDQLYIGSEEWVFHSNSYDKELQNKILKKYFGSIKRWSLERYILAGQAIQAELVRYIFEEFRSRKFTVSGALIWSLSDSFGTNGWALIDYYLLKKPAYYYFKRALSPVSVTWNGFCPNLFSSMKSYKRYYKKDPLPLEIFIVNDTLEKRKVLLKYSIISLNGEKILENSIISSVSANSVLPVVKIELKNIFCKYKPEMVVAIAKLFENGRLINENRYFFVPFSKVRLKPANLFCKKKIDGNIVQLKLESDTFVWMCHIATPDGVEPYDNDFDLIPGETKTILIKTKNAKEYIPQISSMNPSIFFKIEKYDK